MCAFDIVVLHGFGGQGKTSLATQAAEWFTRTHLFERAAFIYFETGARLDFVLNELGNVLVEENFQIHEGDKAEAIARSLKEKPALVVFDNFESALPGGNAPMPDLQALLDAATKWFGTDDRPRTIDHGQSSIVNGRSRLLITTRNTDIPHPSFTPSTNCLHKELEGLAASDALELAASILEAYSLPRPPRVPLENLLTFLKGHPLSLQLALPQLRDYTAEQLVEQYQSILPQMKKGAAKERNESLEVSLRFSLDRLGADALNWLSRLWVFEGGAMESRLLSITEIPEETWNALKPQLTSTALIRIEEIPGVKFPFIHFHPTLAPYLKAIVDSEAQTPSDSIENRQSEIVNRYWQGYYEYANYLYQTDTQHPIQARAIVLRELPNLKRALKLTLSAGALDEAVDFANRINYFLNAFGRWLEKDEMATEVERAVNSSQSSVSSDKITQAQFMMEHGRGARLLQQGRASEAEKVFRALLSQLEGDAEYDTRYDQTLALTYLGQCLTGQGRPSQATEFYQRAIKVADELEQTKDIIGHIGKLHNLVADTFATAGKYAEAKETYQQALDFKKRADDERGQGVTLGQLGTLAMMQGDLNEARKRHLEALSLFQRMGEDQMVAMAWLNLGNVASNKSEWDEAEKCYKEAVSLYEKIGDYVYVASTYYNLAANSQNAGRPSEAERWYLRTLEHTKLLPDQGAKVYNNLASLYLSQNRLDKAEAYARRAVAIVETLDLSSEPWKSYGILAEIAEKRGHKDEVREWRRKEQESFAAFAGSDTKIKQFEPLIAAIVQAANGDEEAKSYLEGEYSKMQTGGEEWAKGAQSIQRLVAGERDMNVLTEGLIREIALIIMRALQVLNGDNREQTTDHRQSSVVNTQSQPQQEQGVTLPQLLELVERAAKGDKEIAQKLSQDFQQASSNFVVPSEQRHLARVLNYILLGNINPDLSELPDEVASAVRGLLGRLKNK